MGYKTEKKIPSIILSVFIVLFVLVGTIVPAYAAPTQDMMVTDSGEMLSDREEQEVSEMLYSINRQTGIEYLVYTIKSLNGEDIETCANRLFRTAGLGDKEKDNGLLLLISYDDRKFRLEVGYGLEGDIPDTQAANIINTMTPYFKEGNYGDGVKAAVKQTAVILNSSGEYTISEDWAAQAASNNEANQTSSLIAAGLVLGICYLLLGYTFWLNWPETKEMTSQDRYVKQVELPIITKEQESQINKRLSVLFSPDENVQERCELNAFVDEKGISKVVLSGMADVVKDKTVYLLKFVSALSHRHFLQCASYMLATGLQKGVIWNIYDNKLYNVEIPDRDAFLNAVVKCVTKGVYDKVYKFVLEKDYTQNLDTILDQIMTDDSLPEFDTGGNVKEEKSQDEGISIIKQGEQYVILDAANRESVDGCAANGYDSILAACEAYVRMNKKKAEETTSKKELLSNIEDWLDNHAEFERQMARISIEINRGIGPYASYSTFSTYVVRKMLKDWGLVINFSERQLLKVWKEREKKRPRPEPTRSVEDVLQEMGFAESSTPPAEVHTPAPAAPAYRVIRSSRLSKPGDVRYIVVEEESSNVLDDANGYGYKSMQAAHKGYAYKRRNGGSFPAQPKKEKVPSLTLQGEQLTFGGV